MGKMHVLGARPPDSIRETAKGMLFVPSGLTVDPFYILYDVCTALKKTRTVV